jgi:phage tail-like protein
MPTEAITAARFSITIDGYEIATFSELTGITSEVEPVEYLEATDQQVSLAKLPGKAKPPTIVLKRGKTGGLELWAWHETVRRGDMAAARKNCTLVMYNTDARPVARYYLEHAWPSKLEISALKAGSGEVLYETVTLTCEHLQRVAP